MANSPDSSHQIFDDLRTGMPRYENSGAGSAACFPVRVENNEVVYAALPTRAIDEIQSYFLKIDAAIVLLNKIVEETHVTDSVSVEMSKFKTCCAGLSDISHDIFVNFRMICVRLDRLWNIHKNLVKSETYRKLNPAEADHSRAIIQQVTASLNHPAYQCAGSSHWTELKPPSETVNPNMMHACLYFSIDEIQSCVHNMGSAVADLGSHLASASISAITIEAEVNRFQTALTALRQMMGRAISSIGASVTILQNACEYLQARVIHHEREAFLAQAQSVSSQTASESPSRARAEDDSSSEDEEVA